MEHYLYSLQQTLAVQLSCDVLACIPAGCHEEQKHGLYLAVGVRGTLSAALSVGGSLCSGSQRIHMASKSLVTSLHMIVGRSVL